MQIFINKFTTQDSLIASRNLMAVNQPLASFISGKIWVEVLFVSFPKLNKIFPEEGNIGL